MVININRNYKDDFTESEKLSKEKARLEVEKLMAEFLAKGGSIEKLEPGIAKGATGLMGQKLQYSDADIKRQAREREENEHTGSKKISRDSE
jgi:hypothetical protein